VSSSLSAISVRSGRNAARRKRPMAAPRHLVVLMVDPASFYLHFPERVDFIHESAPIMESAGFLRKENHGSYLLLTLSALTRDTTFLKPPTSRRMRRYL